MEDQTPKNPTKKLTGFDPCAALFFTVTDLINYGESTYGQKELATMQGLSARQKMALFTIEEGTRKNPDGLPLSIVAETMSIPKPSASQLVESLVKKELVQRTTNPENHRSVQIKLTENGKKLTHKIVVKINAKLCELLEGLSPEDIEIFEKTVLHCFARKNLVLRKK